MFLPLQLRHPVVNGKKTTLVPLPPAVTNQPIRHRHPNMAPGVLHKVAHAPADFRTHGGSDGSPAERPRGQRFHDEWRERLAFFPGNAAPRPDPQPASTAPLS